MHRGRAARPHARKGADTGRDTLVVGRVLPFGKRDALGVTKLRVRLGPAVLVPADLGRLVALGQGDDDRVEHRSAEPDAGFSAAVVTTATNASRFLCNVSGIRFRRSRMTCCRWRPSASSLAPASPRFFDLARFWKPRCSCRRAMRSSLAWKFSRSGRSTVILRKPKRVVGKTWLTTRSSSLPSLATMRVSPSRQSARSSSTSSAFSGGISRRLSPRPRRIGDQNAVASMSCTRPLRSAALRFVSSQT